MVWSIHHAVIDGWSISQVFREVFTAYEALRRREQPMLPPVRPYVDYIAWLGEQAPDSAERSGAPCCTGSMRLSNCPPATTTPADRRPKTTIARRSCRSSCRPRGRLP